MNYNLSAKKEFGQHFLKNHAVLEKIYTTLTQNLTSKDTVLEIGSGNGSLTQYLDDLSNKVYLNEIDPDMWAILEKKFATRPLIPKNILEVDFDTFENPLFIVGNLPYYISSQIVLKMVKNSNRISGFLGLFQQEVAKRICSEHNTKIYGTLSIYAQLYFSCSIIGHVECDSFVPPPKVKSSIVFMKRNSLLFEPKLFKMLQFIIKKSFSQRRKKLSNSLKGITVPKFLECYQSLRPENVSPTVFLTLAQSMMKNG